MATFDAFSAAIYYKFQTRWYSISTFVVLLLKFVAIVVPLVLVFEAGGLWLRHRLYVETPAVRFMHKYLLIAERDFDSNPIVCSTFSVYQKNRIIDDCNLVKIREIDIDRDKQKDILNFETQFYSDEPIRSLKLVLFFQFEIKDIVPSKIESLAVIDCILPHQVQKVHVMGDLKLNQKGPIRKSTLPEQHNESLDLNDYSLAQVLSRNAKRKFSAEIINDHVSWKTGFSNEEPIVLSGEIFYLNQLLYYQPYIWEEVKWAWIQYLSILVVFLYLKKHLLNWLFTKSYLRSYLVIPWKKI